MLDGIGLAEALLGLDGFRVLEVTESPAELVIDIETTVELVGCGECGTRAESQDRMVVEVRDLACFVRPARLVWRKRRWRCVEAECDAKTLDRDVGALLVAHGAHPPRRGRVVAPGRHERPPGRRSGPRARRGVGDDQGRGC